jgi:hypothetical protein
MVSGTLKRFVQVHEIREDPRWSLRSVTPDEAFYFNKFEGNHVSFTGHRAVNLIEFSNILRHVELSSVDYHLRSDINDFQAWLREVVCDQPLAESLAEIKQECSGLDRKIIRHKMIERTNDRINSLLEAVKPKGYV